MAQWKTINCPNCAGHGLITGMDGGPEGCPDCGSGGFFWISDKDRLADYPGGPLRGSWPGRYSKARQSDESMP